MSWITDGSPGFTVNGNVVTHLDENDVDNVFNCMWQEHDGVSSGKHYWKINFRTLDGGGGVGLTTKKSFGKGYQCKGFCYNGNLSDGTSLLVADFGQSPAQGDTIGILVSFEGDRLKVYLDINDNSLGLAFNVSATKFTPIYPMVRFKHSGSATCIRESEIPDLTKCVPNAYTGIEGNWKLKRIQEGSNSFVLQNFFVYLRHSPTSEIRKIGENEYSWYTEVLNSFRTTLSIVNGMWKTDSVCQTLIGGRAEVKQFESKIYDLISNVTTVEVDPEGTLHINSATITSAWKRCNVALPRCFNVDRRCHIM